MSTRNSLAKQCRQVWLALLMGLGVVQAFASIRVDALVMDPRDHILSPKKSLAQLSTPVTSITLPASDQTKTVLEDQAGARQIGVARMVEVLASRQQAAEQLRWVRQANGGHTTALQLKTSGWGIRLGVRWHALPAQAVVRLYAGGQGAALQEVTGAALLERLPVDPTDGARVWWTPDVGPEPVLELLLPPTVDASAVALSIPQVSEIVVSPAQLLTEASAIEAPTLKRRSNGCQQDVNCQNSLLDMRNSIIRMVYVSAAKTFQCTGTLVNNIRQDKTPYVLTAAHCAQDQATASTLQTSWFFYSQTCNSETLFAGHAERYNGARWLASSLAQDMTLLELSDSPPEGSVFAGWDGMTQSTGAAASTIHHPRGDLQKFNSGVLKENAACTVDYGNHLLHCNPGAQSDGSFYRVSLTSGSIEGGSSGAALFVNGRVIGTLTGGDSWCPQAAAQTVYGRLDLALRSAFLPWLGSALTSDTARSPVYQFRVRQSGASFYTASEQERDDVITALADFLDYVGIAFSAETVQTPGSLAVHRFFNAEVVAHFYTANAAESEYVKATYPQLHYEGIAWWVPAQPQQGTHALYRSYQFSTRSHRYTTDESLRDVWQRNPDYSYDGLAYYVWAAP